MKKKLTRNKIVKKLDQVFSIFIRLRDCDKHGVIVCPLCGAKIPWKKAQNMHFITRGCWLFRYDEDNCHAGCMRCNVILNGNYIIYTRWMQKKYGMEKIDEMINRKHEIFKRTTPQLEEMITEYTDKINDLIKKKHLY